MADKDDDGEGADFCGVAFVIVGMEIEERNGCSYFPAPQNRVACQSRPSKDAQGHVLLTFSPDQDLPRCVSQWNR